MTGCTPVSVPPTLGSPTSSQAVSTGQYPGRLTGRQSPRRPCPLARSLGPSLPRMSEPGPDNIRVVSGPAPLDIRVTSCRPAWARRNSADYSQIAARERQVWEDLLRPMMTGATPTELRSTLKIAREEASNHFSTEQPCGPCSGLEPRPPQGLEPCGREPPGLALMAADRRTRGR